jgi:hypothetical protein
MLKGKLADAIRRVIDVEPAENYYTRAERAARASAAQDPH